MSDASEHPINWDAKPEPWRTIGLRARDDFRRLADGEIVEPPRSAIPKISAPVVVAAAEPVGDDSPILSDDIGALRIGLKFCNDPARRSQIKARIAELRAAEPGAA